MNQKNDGAPAGAGEDDLTWLARNVPKWVKHGGTAETPGHHLVVVVCPSAPGGYDFWLPGCAQEYVFTRQEWLARRAELQSKPSWNNAPELAGWLAQSSDGCWFFHEREPSAGSAFWISAVKSSAGMGEVLGDWRDTLEKRPECHSRQGAVRFVTESASEARSIVSLEPLPLPADSSDWFERNARPPVGTVCRVTECALDNWRQVLVKGYYEGQVWLSDGEYDYMEVDFRPIRTERDLLAEVVINCGAMSGYQIADAILAAGFRRGGV